MFPLVSGPMMILCYGFDRNDSNPSSSSTSSSSSAADAVPLPPLSITKTTTTTGLAQWPEICSHGIDKSLSKQPKGPQQDISDRSLCLCHLIINLIGDFN